MPEERRVVTVLFATVDGLEGAARAGTPEDAREVADVLFTRLRRVVEARGGTVDKILGDTLMAVFGAPVAHEDDPARALRAALGIRSEIDLFAAQRDAPLSGRAGVNLGEVLWGTVAGDRATAMGDAVNVAQRLNEECPPGGILASRAVLRGCGSRFALGAERELTVRNRQEPVAASLVDRELPPQREAGGSAVRLVGRDAELARLERAFAGGRGAFVVLEADSGTGKTRLALELRRRVGARGAAWVGLGHAQEGSRIPLAPFAEIVRTAARAGRTPGASETEATGTWLGEILRASIAAEGERRALAALMVQSMGHTEGETRVGGAVAARGSRDQQDAWLRWASALAARGPVLLIVDDVHWADPGTLTLLEALPAHLAGRPFMVVATSRPPSAGSARSLRNFERLRLPELAPDACVALARSLLGRPPDDALASFLVERSGGNPLFLEELAVWLAEEGYIAGDPARFVRQPHTLPDGLRGLLVARLDTVTAGAREALKVGSVFGRAFWTAETGRLAGTDVEPALLQAERADLVARHEASFLPDDVEFSFRQTPFRDAAYSLLTRKERLRLHAGAADGLEARAPALGRRAVILAARHREEAGDPSRGAALWVRAAQNAYAQSAYEEALGHAREAQRLDATPAAVLVGVRALSALGLYEVALAEAQELAGSETVPAADRLGARCEIASIHERQGRFEDAIAVLDAVDADPAGAAFTLKTLRIRVACLMRLTRYDEAERALDRIEQGAREYDAAGNRSAALDQMSVAWTTRARIHFQRERLQESLHAYRKKLEIDRELGAANGVALARNGIGMILRDLGQIENARAEYDAALAHFRESGSRWHIAMVLTNLSLLEFEGGNAEAGLRHAEEGLAIREEMGDRWGAAMLRSNLGTWQARAGRFQESLDLLQRALVERRGTGDRAGVARTLLNLAGTLIPMGRAEEALAALAEAMPIMKEAGQRSNVLSGLTREAEALAALGRGAEAASKLEEALAIPPGERDQAGPVTARLELAWLLEESRPERAKALAAEVAGGTRAGAAGALAEGLLGLHDAAAGRPAEARRRLERMRERMPQPAEAADRFRAGWIEARLLARLGDAAAGEVAARGEDLAREAGAELWRGRFRILRGGP